MTIQITAGTYTVAAGDRSVYETDGGALMFACDCWLDEQTSITARQCLVSKDGNLMEKTIDNLKEALGWDGSDPCWLQDVATLPNFDIVVDFEEYKGKHRPVVKFINPIGGGGVQKGDRTAILAKFGAKFRAVATVSRPAPVAAPRAPVAPPVPKAPVSAPPVAPPAAPQGAGMTMQEAWARVLEVAGNDRDKATANWRRETEKIGKPQSEMSNQDWATVVAGCDDIPY
jgi:hypothetical protein